jgi:hypothetical protein
MERIPKPAELLDARESSVVLFDALRRWFGIGPAITLDLVAIDSAVREIHDVQFVMSLAMRKLQVFHSLAAPGTPTTTDMVITTVQDLERALQQAPRIRLRRLAAHTDWDAELAQLDAPLDDDPDPGTEGDEASDDADGLEDAEAREFRAAHRTLRHAAQAVLRASEGRIRRLD